MNNELMISKIDNDVSNSMSSLFSQESFSHYAKVAEFLSRSSLVPRHMQNKPSDILIAMEMGNQLGLPMMQAIQDIAIINNKPCLWGDSLLALVQAHKDYEWIEETPIKDNSGVLIGFECKIKRKNNPIHAKSFMIDDAKKALLWGKSGPWTQYPERMLQMRARGFCIRDMFADALKGVKSAEEIRDTYMVSEKKSSTETHLKSLLEKDVAIIHDKTNNICTIEQLETMRRLMEEISFSEERKDKALNYYKESSFDSFTEEKANHFIINLNKEIKKSENTEEINKEEW